MVNTSAPSHKTPIVPKHAHKILWLCVGNPQLQGCTVLYSYPKSYLILCSMFPKVVSDFVQHVIQSRTIFIKHVAQSRPESYHILCNVLPKGISDFVQHVAQSCVQFCEAHFAQTCPKSNLSKSHSNAGYSFIRSEVSLTTIFAQHK